MTSGELEVLMKLREDPFRGAREYKERTNGKVVGYFCCYAPEEMIYAAGALPVRVTGRNSGVSRAGAHLQSYCCSLARTGLDMALDGGLSFLDGMVFVHTCDTMMRSSDIWRLSAGFEFHGDVVLPVRFGGDAAWDYMVEELASFRKRLEGFLGDISDEKLAEAVHVYNENRSLLARLYAMRLERPSIMPYGELLWCAASSALIDKREHNAALKKIIAEIEERAGSGDGSGADGKVPLFGIGSVMDQWEFLEMVEEVGATFVDDDFCNGHRYFDASVPGDVPPLEGIARRVWDRNVCACKHTDTDERSRLIVERAKAAGARGAVFWQFKFCEPQAFDYPHVKKALEEAGIQSLNLEIEQGSVSIEQLRTRVAALVETLKS